MDAHRGDCTMTETLASHLVNGLAGHGVDRVFAIPGVHNTELFRGLTESGIAVVLPRHEQSAGFMADGFARATGRPGVCFVVTGPGLTTVLTGFLLGGPVADLFTLSVDESGDRRVQLYAFDGAAWTPTFETDLGPDVSFVDVAAIDGRDRLIAYEPGGIRALDLESGTSRALVAVVPSFDPRRDGPIPHADVTRGRERGRTRRSWSSRLADGFRVFVQTGDGAFADPVTVGPPAELARIYGADGYRFDPWSESRIHEMDFDGDGRRDLAFWNGDRFEVRRQNPSGLFSANAETFTTEVAFDSDDLASLASGDMRGRVLDALTDVNGDGVADLVIASLQGRPPRRQAFRSRGALRRPAAGGRHRLRDGARHTDGLGRRPTRDPTARPRWRRAARHDGHDHREAVSPGHPLPEVRRLHGGPRSTCNSSSSAWTAAVTRMRPTPRAASTCSTRARTADRDGCPWTWRCGERRTSAGSRRRPIRARSTRRCSWGM